MSDTPASSTSQATTSTRHLPLWLLAELTYDCPLKCPYCSNPLDLGSRDDELSTEQWLKVLDEGRQLGAVQLGLSGGEPLLRKDLETIVTHASSIGFYSNLITSGIGLTEKRIEQLKAAGLDHIQVSFQSSDPDLNDSIAGRGRAFAQKLKMAKKIKAEGYPMVLNFVITKQNIAQLPEIMALSCELHADYVELATVQYYGWAYLNRQHLMPTREELETAEAYVNEFRAKQTEQPEHITKPKFLFVTPDYYETRPKPCMNGWATTFLNVAPDGAALPCHSARMLPIDFPNVKQHSLTDIWHASDAMNRFRGNKWMPEPCQSCENKDNDFGGCRCQAYMLTGKMENTDPVCDKSQHHHIIQQAREQAQQGVTHSELIYRDKRHQFSDSDILRVKL